MLLKNQNRNHNANKKKNKRKWRRFQQNSPDGARIVEPAEIGAAL